MKAKRPKLVSVERAIALIDCYGANDKAWPADELVAAMSLVQESTELQQRLHQAQQLDTVLNDIEISDQRHLSMLTTRIMEQLPNQKPVEKINTFVAPTKLYDSASKTYRKKSMIAAGIMLLAGSYFLLESHFISTTPSAMIAQPELDQWIWDEINDNNENDEDEEISFMYLVELET